MVGDVNVWTVEAGERGQCPTGVDSADKGEIWVDRTNW